MSKKGISVKRTWSHVHFSKGESDIELMMDYENKTWVLMSENEDQLVGISKEHDNSLEESFNKAECITAALNYVQNELGL